jgi:hypothetical protein
VHLTTHPHDVSARGQMHYAGGVGKGLRRALGGRERAVVAGPGSRTWGGMEPGWDAVAEAVDADSDERDEESPE